MADTDPVSPAQNNPAPRQRTANADIYIDNQEHNALLTLKLVRNQVTGEQMIRVEFEVSSRYIKLVNAYIPTTDLNVVLAAVRQD